MKLLLLNGPNLNLLGTREPGVYGSTTLPQIEQQLVEMAREHDAQITCFQSNHEGALIDRIHQARIEAVDGIIINPGGLTHTSVALRDALSGVAIPFVEVHISNIHKREAFRHHSYLSDVGLGPEGYKAALRFLLTR